MDDITEVLTEEVQTQQQLEELKGYILAHAFAPVSESELSTITSRETPIGRISTKRYGDIKAGDIVVRNASDSRGARYYLVTAQDLENFRNGKISALEDSVVIPSPED